MESLDELLADLHNATTVLKTEQRNSSQSRGSYRSSGGSCSAGRNASRNSFEQSNQNPMVEQARSRGDYRNSTGSSGSGDYPMAPPLPPPPSRDIIDEVTSGYSSEPVYEPQNLQYNSKVIGNSSISPRVTNNKVGGQSALGANLNELDYLLQDLNSSHFMQAMSQSDPDKSTNNSHLSPTIKSPPPTKPKPTTKTMSPKGNVTFNISANNSGKEVPASSATKELDELMESLSQFKMNSNLQKSTRNSSDTPYSEVSKPLSSPCTPSTRNELDSMLGNLESDMKDQGVTVSTKGVCGACSKPVVGQVITALGKIWHIEHFCCYNCHEELGTRSFFERDGMPYCESCYHQLFAPLCGKCNTAILDKCVTAMDTTWHMECFVCDHCGRALNDEVFHEKDGRPYCRDDYFEIFAPKCGGCEQPIIEDFISTLNRQWHTQCFRCMECGVTLAGGSFYDHDGAPYCETHYYAKRGSLCAGCQKPITGRCITAMFRKFHPEHFVCAFCLKQLNKGTFKEQNDKPYCHPCFVKLFG